MNIKIDIGPQVGQL